MEFYRRLDCLDEVEFYQEQPFQIPYVIGGRRRTYIPDLIVAFKDGSTVVCEIKSALGFGLYINLCKWTHLHAYCESMGYGFFVGNHRLPLQLLAQREPPRRLVEAMSRATSSSRSYAGWQDLKRILMESESHNFDLTASLIQKGFRWTVDPFRVTRMTPAEASVIEPLVNKLQSSQLRHSDFESAIESSRTKGTGVLPEAAHYGITWFGFVRYDENESGGGVSGSATRIIGPLRNAASPPIATFEQPPTPFELSIGIVADARLAPGNGCITGPDCEVYFEVMATSQDGERVLAVADVDEEAFFDALDSRLLDDALEGRKWTQASLQLQIDHHTVGHREFWVESAYGVHDLEPPEFEEESDLTTWTTPSLWETWRNRITVPEGWDQDTTVEFIGSTGKPLFQHMPDD